MVGFKLATRPIGLLVLLAILPVWGLACSDSSADVFSRRGALAAEERSERARNAERLTALYDYVATDYAGAVKDGAVLVESEYEEQLRLVDDMRRLAGELGAPAREKLDELDALIRGKAPAAAIAERCAALRREVVTAFDVALAPAAPPDFARASSLYQLRCAECHGPDGRSDTPRAKTLKPAPANLLDPARMAGVTPYRAYCAITYGINETSMAAHSIPANERWSLAFYAVSLRHRELAAAPLDPAHAPGPRPRLGLATLANETDAGLDRLLAPSTPDEGERAREVARLRALAPFEAKAGEAPIALARRLVAEGLDSSRKGDAREADRLILDAYLRGIEEVEGVLASRDPALVAEIERTVAVLRATVRAGHADEADARAARLCALLDRAESAADRSPADAAVLGLAGATLVLREGLEAALIVAAVLAVVRRTGSRAAVRAVHAGWISAIFAGLATFAVARSALASLALQRELVEGAVSILAAIVLFFTSFWLISKADARRWLAYLKARASGSAERGQLLGLASVAFLAVYREAFESVLFFEALAGGERARLPALAGGVAAGGAALAVAVYAIGRLERRLPIGPFFAASGAALSGLSVVLLGHGVHALEQTSLLAPRPVGFARIAWLGIYPDAVGLAAQAALAAAIVVASLAFFARAGRRES